MHRGVSYRFEETQVDPFVNDAEIAQPRTR